MNDCARLWKDKKCHYRTTEECRIENSECPFYLEPKEKALEVLKEYRFGITTINDTPIKGADDLWYALGEAIQALSEKVSK